MSAKAGRMLRLIPACLVLLLFLPGLLFGQLNREWEKDVLGDDFEVITLEMPEDYEGEVVTTVVRKRAAEEPSAQAVLYIHGFNDYFFQTELAGRFNEQGFDFYAVDLRKYGRSWREHQQMTNVRELSEYYADIDTALALVHEGGPDRVLLAAHSTGGLTATLYAADRAGSHKFDVLWLNSPFYEFNEGFWNRNIMLPMVSFMGRFSPDRLLPASDEPSMYSKSIRRDGRGEWKYDTTWKTENQRISFGWIRAIRLGHKRVASGLEIPVPVLVMHSDKTITGDEWSEDFFTGDAVLDVEHIKEGASKLSSPDLTVMEIEDGMHDLILSREQVRETVYENLFEWLQARFRDPEQE